MISVRTENCMKLYKEAALRLIVRCTTLAYINPCNFNYVWSRVSNKNANEMP